MEIIREAKVTIEIDTNKRTIKKELEMAPDESFEAFLQRIDEEFQEI